MFYTYDQNNSGGVFEFDAEAGLSRHVIIEADSASEANEKAEQIGVYFDDEDDCQCCGSRWGEKWASEEGNEVPMIYGDPVAKYRAIVKWQGGEPGAYIHYKDGRIESYPA